MRAFVVAALLSTSPAIAADSPQQPKSVDGKDRMVCRRETPIGSLIASRKRCMTKAQWEQVARDGNEMAQRMIDDNRSRAAGPGY